MYHSHYILLIQSILVFPIASDENLGVEARDCRGKAACYTPNFLKFPEISCGFLKRVLEKRKYMEIGNSWKSKEIYGNIMLLPTIYIFCFSWWSVGGHAYTLGSGVVSWQARKQKTVAASSCEAEYTAAFEASKEGIWLRTLLNSIDHAPTAPTTICCDNNAAINLSEDPALHDRVKHIDIKHHFLRERVQSNEISLSYINTNDNVADIFTKALDTKKFGRFRQFLGLGWPTKTPCEEEYPRWGGVLGCHDTVHTPLYFSLSFFSFYPLSHSRISI